ncbi:MAG: SDR family oxidoreductase, partial [Kiloniellales bacterium]|nr:SDR family oxidoreductase [Kiloniellales bacterium]
MPAFPGMNAIVTGGAGGIGGACARALAKKGASVLIADLDEDAAKRLAEQLRKDRGTAQAFGLDVRNRASVEKMVAMAEDSFGQLHIVIHAAGIGIERGVLETSLEDWEKVISINLTGSFLV